MTSNSIKWIIPLLVWVLAAIYVGAGIDQGWVPHDEGSLAQSAERVLAGELPHRDFDEIYTGGLSYLNALTFRFLGTNLISLRVVLFAFFLAWVPALYYIASRFVAPLTAGAASLLGVVWSVPNYSAAMPSWYNLFFAVFGTAALLRYLETERARWLGLAGACAGLSCLAKVAGLYYVAAVLLFLVFREQYISRASQETTPKPGQAYGRFVQLALLLFVLVLFTLSYSGAGTLGIVHFMLPGTALVVLFFWNERTQPQVASWTRFATLGRLVAPFAVGLAFPLMFFLIPYVASGSLSALFNGVFVMPLRRLSFAAIGPPGLFASVFSVLPLVLFLAGSRWRAGIRLHEAAIVVLMLAAGLQAASEHFFVYQLVWYSIRTLAPVTVLAGVMLLTHPRSVARLSSLRCQQVNLMLCVTAMVSLVQFPFSAPIYFCYVAPVIVLAVVAVVSSQERESRFAPAVVLCFYLVFGILWVNRGFIYNMGYIYAPSDQTEVLALDRGGLRVSPKDSQEYENLVATMQLHARGEFAYATPDCPEVYFLTGLRNPTRTIIDFFDDPIGRAARILDALEQHGVNVVALNHAPGYSDDPTPELVAALTARYPYAIEVGRFEVRWRE